MELLIVLLLLVMAAIILFGIVRSVPSLIIRIRETVEAIRDAGKPPEGPVDEPFDPDRRI
jgi:hypothetical protein